ncbi:MAG: hypothetical protein JJE52_13160 [Acidimicrobiia bacterium]|nr:hypothetical protein [Acidimicrobiia bacterium]
MIAARAADAEDAIQVPVNDGRHAYDGPTRAALDALEVEVPPDVWAAIFDLVTATRTLDELADGAARAALVQDLGDAEDDLAVALDERDATIRSRWHLGLAAATRVGRAAAAETTAVDRRRHYVQGDGPSGRTPIEL